MIPSNLLLLSVCWRLSEIVAWPYRSGSIALVMRTGDPVWPPRVLWPSGLQSTLTRLVFLRLGPSFL